MCSKDMWWKLSSFMLRIWFDIPVCFEAHHISDSVQNKQTKHSLKIHLIITVHDVWEEKHILQLVTCFCLLLLFFLFDKKCSINWACQTTKWKYIITCVVPTQVLYFNWFINFIVFQINWSRQYLTHNDVFSNWCLLYKINNQVWLLILRSFLKLDS